MSTATSETTTEDTDVTVEQTSLKEAIKNEADHDHRPCPHKCYGSLSVVDASHVSTSTEASPREASEVEDDVVLCQTCRHTPDGEYVPPKYEDDDDGSPDDTQCSQYIFFHPNMERRFLESQHQNPWGRWGENTDPRESYYDFSKKPRMFGGNWRVYSANNDVRPDGITEEYTFDLSTL
jgi:hypothetical protein